MSGINRIDCGVYSKNMRLRKLLTQQNQVSYAALFSRPAFALWGDGKTILDGLFNTFSKRGISLASFRFGQGTQDQANQSVTVTFSPFWFYRFQLDRVESTLDNFTDQELTLFPEVLQEGANWLKTVVPHLEFQSHLFTYSGHHKLSEGTSREVLDPLTNVSMSEIGSSEGNGIIVHWEVPDQKWRLQLTVDQSLTVLNGLFTHFILFINDPAIDYATTAVAGRAILQKALNNIGLEFDDAS